MPGPNQTSSLAKDLEDDLISRYGPMLSNETLRIALGYPSKEAFRQALSRNRVPIPVFSLPKQRGKYALAKDVAAWLATRRDSVVLKAIKPKE